MNAKFVASIRIREHGAKVGGADSLRLERTSAKETKTSHTEECGEGSSGGRGKRQRWKRWNGCRRAQGAEAQELLRGIHSSHGSDAQRLLRNEQDTRFLCGVVFDTYIVSSQLNAAVAAEAQTQACNDAAQQKGRGHGLGPVGVGGSGPRTHHGRNDAGKGTGAALGSHGRVEQAVDGEVRDGQTRSNRQDFPATAVQGHSRRRDAASALCGGEEAGSVTRRKKAGTGTSNGTGTRTSRLVGGHEVRGGGSAREKVLETSIFLAEQGTDSRSEKWKMMVASQAIQQQARVWHARRVPSVFSSGEASLLDGSCAQSSSVFFSHRIQHEERRRSG